MPELSLTIGGESVQIATAMKIFLFVALLSVGPAILLTMTSFTRIVIVLCFLKQAVGFHRVPPNQVLIGMALFLSIFLMSPVLKQVHTEALKPLFEGTMDYTASFEQASEPIKKFMFQQTRKADIELLLSVSKSERPKDLESLPISLMIPAFILSELKTAFQIGCLIYLPFVLIDMIVGMVLLSTGMFMLSPLVVSLPFKLILFVLVDGWSLVVGSLLKSFGS